MRIGMILDKTFPPDPRVENEALALIESGHKVFLFCLGYKLTFEEEIINEIEVKRYPSNQLEYKASALAYTLPLYKIMMSKKVTHFLNENHIDMIHVHDMVIADAVFKANNKLHLPVVLDLHENRPEIMKSYPHLGKFPGNILISPEAWKRKEVEFVKKADKVIVVTKESKEELVDRTEQSKDKFVVVPNTVKRSFYENYSTDLSILEKYKDKFVLLYLGDTGLRRGLISAIEAMGILCKDKEMKDVIKLVIVGKNSSDEILKQKVAELDLNEVVDFEGWQDVSLFPSYLMAAHLGISPLHRNLYHDTTYANKLFQYMSFSLPLLVSDVRAQKNLINEVKSGLVHKEKDANEIAEKIMLLFNDPKLCNELGQNGKHFIEQKFSWEKVSRNLKDLYLEFEKS
ncbi:glycosyltransferase family 4 protein [Lutimonas halocynthiae]|uniref:glycosyltransferase family 4 protein n=1 Tax=Lutimonas halocynthiae TaxID=1446477 RepID=UPI0025B3FD27|nr:glycosyltransferase family 4 protein [Lutimonas halocynthiae]MDN3642362.1 glycosyltransferase family 4 protein [Lutimonas halocynthiae]